ncbi:MAG: DUF2252 family protein [Pseudobdellovibrio sp.]
MSASKNNDSNSLIELKFSAPFIAKNQIREDYSFLSDHDFQNKIDNSRSNAFLFFRSFVITYYKDISALNTFNQTGFCFGDLHPENFGFMISDKNIFYSFNDFDDSTICHLDLDLLRYFTALRIGINDEPFFKKTLAQFSRQVSHPEKYDLPHSLIPDLNKKREKDLKKYTSKDKFIFSEELQPLDSVTNQMLKNALSQYILNEKLEILDVAGYIKSSGGSAGLQRFWILTKNSQTKLEILELKPLLEPAPSFINGSETLSASERIHIAQQLIWKKPVNYYKYIKIGQQNYIIRSRVQKSFDLNVIKNQDLETIIFKQIEIISNFHRDSIKNRITSLAEWIDHNSRILKARYLNSLDHL